MNVRRVCYILLLMHVLCKRLSALKFAGDDRLETRLETISKGPIEIGIILF